MESLETILMCIDIISGLLVIREGTTNPFFRIQNRSFRKICNFLFLGSYTLGGYAATACLTETLEPNELIAFHTLAFLPFIVHIEVLRDSMLTLPAFKELHLRINCLSDPLFYLSTKFIFFYILRKFHCL